VKNVYENKPKLLVDAQKSRRYSDSFGNN